VSLHTFGDLQALLLFRLPVLLSAVVGLLEIGNEASACSGYARSTVVHQGLIFVLHAATLALLPTGHLLLYVANIERELTLRRCLVTINRRGALDASADVARKTWIRYVVHEIRNPFHSIRLGLDSLTDPPHDLDEEQRETAGMVQTAAENMGAILDSVMLLSQFEENAFRLRAMPMDLHALVDSVVHQFMPWARQARIGLSGGVEASVPRFLGMDRPRLTTLFCTLLGNALRNADFPGGRVRLQVSLGRGEAHGDLRLATRLAVAEVRTRYCQFGVTTLEGPGGASTDSANAMDGFGSRERESQRRRRWRSTAPPDVAALLCFPDGTVDVEDMALGGHRGFTKGNVMSSPGVSSGRQQSASLGTGTGESDTLVDLFRFLRVGTRNLQDSTVEDHLPGAVAATQTTEEFPATPGNFVNTGREVVVCMSVEDNGPAASAAELRRLIEPLTASDEDLSGSAAAAEPSGHQTESADNHPRRSHIGATSTTLGYALVKELVFAARGSIAAVSSPGYGTTFLIVLKRKVYRTRGERVDFEDLR
jgi:signal transduction histidine kinase